MTQADAPGARPVTLPRHLTVRDLSEALGVTPVDIIKELMKRGVMAAINQSVDYDVAAAVAKDLGFEAEPEARAGGVGERMEHGDEAEQLKPRPPVVTVMGHVDHGKTSLLDAIRQTNVVASEAGAITQHIGAYQVEVPNPDDPKQPKKVTFIDTPGHEAFTAMRARGATVTDLVVLVVAADDGIMPQTREAIDHTKAAGVPMIVAINKIDLPAADPTRVKTQLTESSVVIEEYGGETPAIEVSAKTKKGLDSLLEHILLVAEISDLRANPDRPAEGTVIESEKDPSRGPMATVIIQKGTLRISDIVVAGEAWGKVKAMFDDKGRRIKEAGPSMPVEIMGLEMVPRAGDVLGVAVDERTARDMADERRREQAEATQSRSVTLEAVSGEIAAGRVKDLNVILKADVQGSLEAIRSSLERLSGTEVRVNVIHAGAGNINESDVMLAAASKAIIVGFNVKTEPGGRNQADIEGVDIRNYQIIYELIDDIEKAVKGLMEPVIAEVVDGHAEVRAIFKVRGGKAAGCMLQDGVVRRSSLARVLRGGEAIHESRVSSLKRFTEDVREVTAGLECGIGVEKFDAWQEGDVIEAFHTEQRG